jgi:CheY-like chemotaxis protein
MDRLSVLIVEDNPADMMLIKEYLSERKDILFDIHEAGTLDSALKLLLHNDYDVILLDLFLHDSSGLDTVRRVITTSPDIPVIVLTGLQDEEVAVQAVRYGAQDYLEKQYLTSVLLNKSVIYAIERKRILQEKEDLFHDFNKALQLIERLEGILPICVSCKKILDEEKAWLRIEDYIRQHADGEVIKLVCPNCIDELEQDRNG